MKLSFEYFVFAFFSQHWSGVYSESTTHLTDFLTIYDFRIDFFCQLICLELHAVVIPFTIDLCCHYYILIYIYIFNKMWVVVAYENCKSCHHNPRMFWEIAIEQCLDSCLFAQFENKLQVLIYNLCLEFMHYKVIHKAIKLRVWAICNGYVCLIKCQ